MQTSERLPQYIGGQWHAANASGYSDIINPATNEVIARAPLSGAIDVAAAAEAAAAAFPGWRRTPPEDRIQYLFRFKQSLETHFEEIARITTTENTEGRRRCSRHRPPGVRNI